MKQILIVLLLIATIFGKFTWQSCGNGHFKVDSVTMTPYPVKPGQNVTVHAHGVQDETVSSGSWETKVYLHGFEVQAESGKVCDLIPNCPCPCKAGTYTTTQTNYVTSLAPSGSYTGKYTAKDQNGALLSCISYSFDMA